MDEPERKEQRFFLVAGEKRRGPVGLSQTHGILWTSFGQTPDMYRPCCLHIGWKEWPELSSLNHTHPASPSSSQFHKFFQLRNLRGCPWLAERNTNTLAWQAWAIDAPLSPSSPSCSCKPVPHPQHAPTWGLCSAILSLCLPVLDVQTPPTLPSEAPTRPPCPHPHPAWKSLHFLGTPSALLKHPPWPTSPVTVLVPLAEAAPRERSDSLGRPMSSAQGRFCLRGLGHPEGMSTPPF